MIDAAATAVCDAGPIIHLDELGCIDLLYDFPSVVIPSCVAHEVHRNRHVNLDSSRGIVRPDDPIDDSMRAIAGLYGLHHGEIVVLAAAQRLNNPLVLTDDAAARLAATAMRIPAHGTLGILLRSVRRQRRTAREIVRVLQYLPSRSSLHIRQCFIDSAIEQLRANSP